jgi:hypothetical protein
VVHKIDQKITGWKIKTKEEPTIEAVKRPKAINGTTYKLKTNDAAVYVTLNNIEVDGKLLPFEIFISTKNPEHFQWTTAVTRLISAVFRRGGNVAFLVQELKEVFDPAGSGIWDGGRRIPSLVAQIGYTIEEHFKSIGLIESEKPNPILEEKKADMKNATICKKCGDKAVVLMDGCSTCCSCGDSKCG